MAHRGHVSVSASLSSQLAQLSSQEKAIVADALWREVDELWEPTAGQLAELNRRAEQAEKNPESTLPVGEEIQRLRR